MKLTIVTVCLNCKNEIKKTIDSLICQTFQDYEFLVIDGNSADGTLEEVNKNEKSFKNLRIVSEPDNGIYDAMNKGANLARGDFVFYLNAGDVLYNEEVLENIVNLCTGDEDVYYGSVFRSNRVEEYPEKISMFWLIYRERMICHQAIVANRKLLIDYPFDCDFRICGDREWLIRILKGGMKIKSIQPLIISIYDTTGVSSNKKSFSKDSFRIARKYKGFTGVMVVQAKRFIGMVIKGLKGIKNEK